MLKKMSIVEKEMEGGLTRMWQCRKLPWWGLPSSSAAASAADEHEKEPRSNTYSPQLDAMTKCPDIVGQYAEMSLLSQDRV